MIEITRATEGLGKVVRFRLGAESVCQMTLPCSLLCNIMYTQKKCSTKLCRLCEPAWYSALMEYLGYCCMPAWELSPVNYAGMSRVQCPWCWRFGIASPIKKHNCCMAQVAFTRVALSKDIIFLILSQWAACKFLS